MCLRAQSLHLLEILNPRQRPQCPTVPVRLCRGSARPPLCLPRSHPLPSATKGFAKEGCSGPSGLPPPRSAACSRDKGNAPALRCRRCLSPRSGQGRAGSALLPSELWFPPRGMLHGDTASAASLRLWEQVGAVGWRQALQQCRPGSQPRITPPPSLPAHHGAHGSPSRATLRSSCPHTVLNSLPGVVRELSTPITHEARSPFY